MVTMNRVYKVIYNRARKLYQVVSEIVHSRGKTKSLTAQHRHDRLTTSILIALFAMGTSLPVGWAADTTVADAKVDVSNIGANLQPADGTTAVTDEEKKRMKRHGARPSVWVLLRLVTVDWSPAKPCIRNCAPA